MESATFDKICIEVNENGGTKEELFKKLEENGCKYTHSTIMQKIKNKPKGFKIKENQLLDGNDQPVTKEEFKKRFLNKEFTKNDIGLNTRLILSGKKPIIFKKNLLRDEVFDQLFEF